MCDMTSADSFLSPPTVEYFVNPQFNLVSFIIFPLICHLNKFSPVVDGCAAFFLISGTYARAQILHAIQENLTDGAIYDLFVFSLASWIAAVILEARTCFGTLKYIVKTRAVIGRIHPENSVKYWLKATTVLAFVFNSSVVMLSFCFDVSESVGGLTSDPWLIFYHKAASVVKTLSAVLQGGFLIVHIFSNHQFYGKKFMLRMAFINFVTVVHSSYLIQFGVLGPSHPTVWNQDRVIRFVSLILDLLFRVGLCCWYVMNWYLHILQERLLISLVEIDYVQENLNIGLAMDDSPHNGRQAGENRHSNTYHSNCIEKFPESRQESTFAQGTTKEQRIVTGVLYLPQLGDQSNALYRDWTGVSYYRKSL